MNRLIDPDLEASRALEPWDEEPEPPDLDPEPAPWSPDQLAAVLSDDYDEDLPF